MVYRVLAIVVVGLHLSFLAYVLAGGFLALRWPRSLLAHVAMVAWGLAGLATRVPCPLTYLQNVLRRRAEQPELASGFIDAYVEGVLYPARFTPLVRVLVAAAVAVSWAGAYSRWHSRLRDAAVGGAGRGVGSSSEGAAPEEDR